MGFSSNLLFEGGNNNLFFAVLEDSVPQGAFVAKLNGRYVSTKQGNFNLTSF